MDERQRPADRTAALLAVVAREELPTYTSITRNFVSATMEVVLDRRSGERRRADARVTTERRRWDRRQHDITTDLLTSGWVLVRRDVGSPSDTTRWSLVPGMKPARVQSEALVSVENETDVIDVRDRGRALAAGVGLSPTESASVAAAVSELVRNLVAYATRGEVILRAIESRRARDRSDGDRRRAGHRGRRVGAPGALLDLRRSRPRAARRPATHGRALDRVAARQGHDSRDPEM